ERQLDADVKLAEVRVLGADRVEAHFVNDGFDLKSIACKKRHAPFRIIQPGRTGDELFYFARELSADSGVAFHQFAALIIWKRVPVALFAATLAHVIETNHRPIRQRGINTLLSVMVYSLAKRRQRFIELSWIFANARLETCSVFILGRDVFAFLGQRQIT